MTGKLLKKSLSLGKSKENSLTIMSEETKTFVIESRFENKPEIWYNCNHECKTLEQAQEVFKNLVKYHRENSNNLYEEFKNRVLEFRIVEKTVNIESSIVCATLIKPVMDEDTEKRIKASLIEAKEDELHFLKEIYKYMKHLEHIYMVGKLENEDMAWQTKHNLCNIYRQIEKLEMELCK